MHASRRASSALAALVLLLSGWLAAAEPPIPPTPTRYFNDYAGLIDAGTVTRLNATLDAFERDTSNQLIVAVFPKLPENTYLEDYTVKVAQAWGAGGKKRDNGVVLFVFVQDRKLRIEVGYGLEGALPDSLCGTIIREEIQPAFKKGQFVAGLEHGIDAIIRATKHEYQGAGKTLGDSSFSINWWLIGILFVVFIIWIHLGDTVFQRGGRFIFWNLIDLLRLIAIASSSNDRSSNSGGSFSGGGGRFGGGGASGGW